MNKLIVIGKVGNKHCYLNMSKSEALDQYDEEPEELKDKYNIEVIQFEDEFKAYDVWKKGA